MSLYRTLTGVVIHFGCMAIWGVALGDTIQLSNGATLVGEIVSEDETQVTIAVALAGGTITTHEVVDRKDIAQIVRETPEEKAQADMERAYAKVRRYQLDPRTSGPVSYYDQVINGVFERFLHQYPDSSHTNEVARMILEWQGERDKVVAGFGKWDGQWMEAARAAKLATEARARLHPERDHKPAVPTTEPELSSGRSVPAPAALNDVENWLSQYWFYGVVAVVVGLWLVTRLFTKQ